MPCDNCDPSFDCWQKQSRCRKPEVLTEEIDPHSPVVCSALRIQPPCEKPRIILGVRHFDPLMRAQIERDRFTGWKTAEQGFVNAKGQFLNRALALHVALACGQRKRRCGGDEHRLFSENLY